MEQDQEAVDQQVVEVAVSRPDPMEIVYAPNVVKKFPTVQVFPVHPLNALNVRR